MADRLAAYAFGALHAALLLYAFVALATLTGARPFTSLGTGPGIALGAWLALLSWSATTWALRDREIAIADARDLLGRAGIAGFAAGAAFVPGVIVGVLVWNRVFEAGSLVIAAFAAPFAGAVGSLLAIALAGIDMGLYALARRIAARG